MGHRSQRMCCVGLLILAPDGDMGLRPYSGWFRDGQVTLVRKSSQFLDPDVTAVSGKRSSPVPGVVSFAGRKLCAPQSLHVETGCLRIRQKGRKKEQRVGEEGRGRYLMTSLDPWSSHAWTNQLFQQ